MKDLSDIMRQAQQMQQRCRKRRSAWKLITAEGVFGRRHGQGHAEGQGRAGMAFRSTRR
jgi:DNA-binding protein YbaB